MNIMRKCERCNARIKSKNQFCPKCGAEIHHEVKPKKKRNLMKIWLVVVSTFLVISLATSATFFILWYQEYVDSEQAAHFQSSFAPFSASSTVAVSELTSSEPIPETKEEFVAKCKTLDYDEFKRAPKENSGEYYKMTGKITGNQLDYLWIQNNSCSELVGTNNKNHGYGLRLGSPNYPTIAVYKPSGNGIPLVQTSNTDGNPRLYPGDEVTIYGICTDVDSFIIANQGYVPLPIITVYYADLK